MKEIDLIVLNYVNALDYYEDSNTNRNEIAIGSVNDGHNDLVF